MNRYHCFYQSDIKELIICKIHFRVLIYSYIDVKHENTHFLEGLNDVVHILTTLGMATVVARPLC